MNKSAGSSLAIALFALAHTAVAAASGLVPVALRCESHDNPLGTDVTTPALIGMIGPPEGAAAAPPRGAKQSAFQIPEASKPELLAADQGDLWASGLVQMPGLGGSIGQWFYKIGGGIRPDPAAPGFKNIIIRPAIAGDLTWLKCSYDSIRGQMKHVKKGIHP